MSVFTLALDALIGGTAGALDKIDGATGGEGGGPLLDGDGALVLTSTAIYFYRLNATSGEAEASPGIIAPDTNAGTKRWILKNIYSLHASDHTDGTDDIQNATTSQKGLLTNTDWNTFNGKIANIVEDTTPQLYADLDGQGNYAVDLQNFPDMLSNGPGYWFDGSTDWIGIADSTEIQNIFDNGGAILVRLNPLSDGESSEGRIIDKSKFALTLQNDDGSTAKVAFYQDFSGTNATWKSSSVEVLLSKESSIMVVYDNSSVANDPIFYVSGKSVSVAAATPVGTRTSDIGSNMGIGGTNIGGVNYDGSMNTVLFFNFTPTAAEVKAFSNGAAIPYKYIGASQTVLTSGTLTVGKRYRIVDWITTDDFTNIGGTNEDGNEFTATGTTPTTWTNSSTVVQIGCVLDLNPESVGHNQWLDNSGNNLHGTVSGALPTNLPTTHTEKYINLAVTDDTSFTLPKGYLISSIILTSTGAIGGGIDIGTTNGGGEIVAAQAIAGAGTVLCTLVAGANYNTTGANDTIYITDADGTGWDAATVEVHVKMERIEI